MKPNDNNLFAKIFAATDGYPPVEIFAASISLSVDAACILYEHDMAKVAFMVRCAADRCVDMATKYRSDELAKAIAKEGPQYDAN